MPESVCEWCFERPKSAGKSACYRCERIAADNRTNLARPLGEPTVANPGSEEKIRVMEERFAAGKALFHPKDNTDSMGRGNRAKTKTIVDFAETFDVD